MLVPPTFAQTTVAREGAAGLAWPASLPEVVDELLTRWSCTPDGDARHGGVGLVVPVRSAHGDSVIKVSFPHEGNAGEVAALQVLDGAAAVRLFAHDEDCSAMLLERADGPGPQHVLDPEESVQMMADLSTRLAVPAGPQMLRLADTASEWRRQLDLQLTHAPPGTVSPTSLARAREAIDLVASDCTTTLLHGDLHEGNVLGADREPWLTIDLKGWAGTAAFDAYTVALTRHGELRHLSNPTRLVRERIHRFASSAKVDPHLAIEIAYARTVSSLLYETLAEANTFGRHLLEQLVTSPL